MHNIKSIGYWLTIDHWCTFTSAQGAAKNTLNEVLLKIGEQYPGKTNYEWWRGSCHHKTLQGEKWGRLKNNNCKTLKKRRFIYQTPKSSFQTPSILHEALESFLLELKFQVSRYEMFQKLPPSHERRKFQFRKKYFLGSFVARKVLLIPLDPNKVSLTILRGKPSTIITQGFEARNSNRVSTASLATW